MPDDHPVPPRPLDPQILAKDLFLAVGHDPTEVLYALNFLYSPTKGGRVLEACCGSGKLGLSYAIRGHCEVELLDIDPEAVRYATRLAQMADAMMGLALPVKIHQGDIFKMPYQDGTFDLAFSEGAHEHWPLEKRRQATAEMLRVTKPGGVVIVFVPNILNPVQKVLSEENTYQWQTMEPQETLITETDLVEDFIVLGLRKVQISQLGRMVLAAGNKP